MAGVLLAAGPSSRLGGRLPKQLLPFEGEPLVRRMARRALASGLAELVVVVGHRGAEVEGALAGLAVRIVQNPDYRDGQSTSVKAGLAAVAPDAEAALFIPVDQPHLTAEVIDRILAAYRATGAPVVVPAFQGRRGAPVLWDRGCFPSLAAITGDQGARQILGRFADRIATVELADERPLLDLDTPEDAQRLAQ